MARIARRPEGNPSERGEAGPDLEGLVSKRRDRPYQAGRSRQLGKGEEPQPPRDGAGDGLISNFLSNLLQPLALGLALSSPFKGSV